MARTPNIKLLLHVLLGALQRVNYRANAVQNPTPEPWPNIEFVYKSLICVQIQVQNARNCAIPRYQESNRTERCIWFVRYQRSCHRYSTEQSHLPDPQPPPEKVLLTRKSIVNGSNGSPGNENAYAGVVEASEFVAGFLVLAVEKMVVRGYAHLEHP